MADYRKDVARLKKPENIKDAVFASGPYTLMKVFEADPTVNRLIKGGGEVVPLIAAELKKNGMRLHEITRACFAYILQRVDLEASVKILKPYFVRAMKKPDPFFVHFAAHALRRQLRLPVKPADPLHSRAELLDTLDKINR
jgi:hypothetical protein